MCLHPPFSSVTSLTAISGDKLVFRVEPDRFCPLLEAVVRGIR